MKLFEASDGIEALRLLEIEQVNMVILDVMMPNMDGWALCKELRENDRASRTEPAYCQRGDNTEAEGV